MGTRKWFLIHLRSSHGVGMGLGLLLKDGGIEKLRAVVEEERLE